MKNDGPTPIRRRGRRLDNISAVRREMGAIYLEARAGRLAWSDATKAIYCLDRIGRAAELEQLEER